MADEKSSDAGMARYIVYGVVAGMLLGVFVGILVPAVGIGFGISIGMILGISAAAITWIMRRPKA